MCVRSSRPTPIHVCIAGVFVASLLLVLAIYSSFRWIWNAGWLGARTPGFEWVTAAVGYTAFVADVAGSAMALIVFWKGNRKHRVLVALPGVFLLGWLVYAAINIISLGHL